MSNPQIIGADFDLFGNHSFFGVKSKDVKTPAEDLRNWDIDN